MAQQTAMQALWEWIDANYHEESFNLNDARDMSLKLEKEQIKDAWANGGADLMSSLSHPKQHMRRNAEGYYNETYNK
jgi:hypothetical protein